MAGFYNAHFFSQHAGVEEESLLSKKVNLPGPQKVAKQKFVRLQVFFLTWGSFYPLKIALQKSFFLLHIFPIILEPLQILKMSKPRKVAKIKSAKKCVNKKQATRAKKCKFDAFWYHFKDRAKKSYL